MSVTERDEVVRSTIAEGERAYMDEGNITHCPYPLHGQQAEWWKRGFMNAEIGTKLCQQK